MRGPLIAISVLSLFFLIGSIPVYSNPEVTIDEKTSAALTEILNRGCDSGTIKALRELGLEPRDTVPWLIDVIDKNEDRLLRIRACEALALIGPDAAQAVPVLTEILQVREVLKDWWLVKSAIEALGAIGSPAADSAGPIIYEILIENADYEEVARLPRDPKGIRSYPKGDREVFNAACDSLKKNGADPIALLMNELESPQPYAGINNDIYGQRKFDVIDTVAKFGKDAVPYLQGLFEKSDDYAAISNCLNLVWKMGPDASELTDTLIALFYRLRAVEGDDPVAAMQASNAAGFAASALQYINPDPDEAVPFFIELASDEDAELAWTAIYALGHIGDERAIPILIKTLDDDREYTLRLYMGAESGAPPKPLKYAAAYALGRIGPKAKDAIPKLVEMLPADEFDVAYALGRMGPDAVAPAVNALLSDNPIVRKNGARAILYMGSDGAYAVDHIIPFIKQETDSEAKDAAIRAIGSIGRAALDVCVEDPISFLIKLLDDPAGDVRSSAAYSLGMFGSKAESALEKLRKLATEDEYIAKNIYPVREAAKTAVERIETNWTPKPKGSTPTGPRPLCPT